MYLSNDLTWTTHWGVMWVYGWELLVACHHPDKFCNHKYCDSGDVFNLSCDLLWAHVWRVNGFFYGQNPLTMSHLPGLVIICLVQVTICLVQVEMWIIYYATQPHQTMRLRDQVTLWVGALQGMLPPCQVCYHICCCSRNMFLVCHMIKKEHITEGSSDYNNSSPSR